MKYIAQGESQVVYKAQGEANHECYICHQTPPRAVYFQTNEVAVL